MAEAPYVIRQFEIERHLAVDLFGLDVSFTNSAAAMTATVLVVAGFLWLAMRPAALVPGRLQAAAEALYGFVAETVITAIGPDGRRHLPFLLTLFVYILFGSLIGLTPVKFTFTSHVVVTLGLGLIVFGYVTVLGFRRQGLGFFRSFLPAGTPWFVAPLVVLVEVVSYLLRPITLGVRLFANVLAGHIMIKLFADFSAALNEGLGLAGFLLGLLPVLMTAVFYGFETVVFVIQAYIFVLLACVYIREASERHGEGAPHHA